MNIFVVSLNNSIIGTIITRYTLSGEHDSDMCHTVTLPILCHALIFAIVAIWFERRLNVRDELSTQHSSP